MRIGVKGIAIEELHVNSHFPVFVKLDIRRHLVWRISDTAFHKLCKTILAKNNLLDITFQLTHLVGTQLTAAPLLGTFLGLEILTPAVTGTVVKGSIDIITFPCGIMKIPHGTNVRRELQTGGLTFTFKNFSQYLTGHLARQDVDIFFLHLTYTDYLKPSSNTDMAHFSACSSARPLRQDC